MSDEHGIDDGKCRVCPCCGQFMFWRYLLGGQWVCGFCRGVGPDGKLTGKHGRHPGRTVG